MNKKNIKVLLDEGFSIKTIRSLSENQRNILVKKILKEGSIEYGDQDTANRIAPEIALKNPKAKIKVMGNKIEVGENQDDLTALTRQDYTCQQGPHDSIDMAPDGMDDDSDNNRSEMNELSDEEIDLMLDIIKSKKSNGKKGEIEEKFQSKSQQKYFFAKCNDESLSKKERNKWCNMADEFAQHTNFKKLPEKVKEDNLKSLEESVMKIVKKHIPASITKGDLVKLVKEAPQTKPSPMREPSTIPAPVKEPGISPSRPERKTPFKPKHKPKPKAGKELPDWMSYSEIFDSEPFTKPAPVKNPDVAPSKPERKTPFQPKHKPKPKADKK